MALPEGDVVARGVVELVADATTLVESTRKAFDDTLRDADTWAVEMAQKYADAFGGDEGVIGQAVAEAAARTKQSLEEVAQTLDDLGLSMGKTKDELVDLGQTYLDNLGENLQQAISSAIFEIQNLGGVTPETAANLRDLAAAGNQVASVNEKIAAQMQQVQQLSRAPMLGGAGGGGLGGLEGLLGPAMKGDIAGIVGQLGKMAGLAGGVLAVVGALRQFDQWVDKSFTEAVKLSAINFRLEVAVRAQQRAHGDAAGTIKEWNAFADQMAEKYGILNDESKQLVATVNQLSLQLGLNQDEMKKLTEASISMGIATGRDAQSMLTQFVMFLNTGYGRSLARMGLEVSAQAQNQQALALGITKPSKEWTEQEKILIRMTLLLSQTAKYQEDAAKQGETLAGRMDKVSQKTNEANESLGNLVAPIKVIIAEMKASLTVDFVKLLQDLGLWMMNYLNGLLVQWGTFWKALDIAIQQAKSGTIPNFKKAWADAFDWASTEVGKGTEKVLKDMAGGMGSLGDAAKDAGTATQDAADQMVGALDDVNKMLVDVQKTWDDTSKKIESDFADKIADLAKSTAQSQADAKTKLDRDLAKMDAAAAEERLTTIRKYQIDEIRLREDHERRLRDMENQYLLDLSDAVRERDALRVLQLERKYNLERAKENESFAVDASRRKQDFQVQLEEQARQAAIRRQQRIIEYQQELADIALNEKRKRDELNVWRDRQYRDLNDRVQQMIQEGLKAIADARNLTVEQLNGLVNDIIQRLGPNSPLVPAVKAAANYVAAGIAAIGQAVNQYYAYIRALGVAGGTSVASPYGGSYGGAYSGMEPIAGRGYTNPYTSGYNVKVGSNFYNERIGQYGLDFVANKPQSIHVGEVPEQVTVTPLTGAPRPGAGGMGGGRGGRGHVEVAIKLDDGLMGEITDHAMSEVADVMVSLTRGESTKAGAGGRR